MTPAQAYHTLADGDTTMGVYVGELLEAWMQALSISTTEIARRTGIKDISMMRRNSVRAGKKRLARIAAALGVTEQEFLDGPDPSLIDGDAWGIRQRIQKTMETWCHGCDEPRSLCCVCTGFAVKEALLSVLSGKSIDQAAREARAKYNQSLDVLHTLYDLGHPTMIRTGRD